MSESRPSKVFMFDNSDPEMQSDYEKARATFRYFCREVAWERRRITPALDLACVGDRPVRRDPSQQVHPQKPRESEASETAT